MSDAIQEKVKYALSTVLQEIDSPLVASERFRADTDRIVAGFDVSLLAADKPREIKVDLRLPSRKEVIKLTLLQLVAQGDRPEGAQVQEAIAAANAALEPYYTGEAAKAWQTQVQLGQTRIVFEGVPHDSIHILNRAYADIEQGSPAAQGAHLSVLKRIHPKASEQQLAALNKPDNTHALMAINGYPLMNYQQQDIDPRRKFAHAVELVESLERVNETEGLLLHPYVKLGRVGGEASTFAVNNLHQVTSGSIYFGKSALPPEGAVHAALLHENYHVLNGDFTSPSQYMAQRISDFITVSGVAAACGQKPQESAEAFLQAAQGNVETAMTILTTMDNLLKDMQHSLKPLCEVLAQTPELDRLDGRALVADIEGEGRSLQHIDAAAQAELPLQSARQFNTLAKHVVAKGREKPVARLAPEDVKDVQAKMVEVLARHKPLFDGIGTLQRVGMAVNHASEMLADKRALRHMDNPENLVAMLRWAVEGQTVTKLGYSHPSIDTRVEAIREWAAEQKPLKADSREKPVVGTMTAALAKRTAQQAGVQR